MSPLWVKKRGAGRNEFIPLSYYCVGQKYWGKESKAL